MAQAVWLAAWPPRYMSTRHTMGGEQEVTTRVITDMPSRYLASQELKVRTHVREPSGTMEEILDVQALLSSAEDPRCPGASRLCRGSQVSRHFSALQIHAQKTIFVLYSPRVSNSIYGLWESGYFLEETLARYFKNFNEIHIE